MATILIADDDTASLDVMSVALSAEGHDVITAADGQEAYERALEARPDLILLDVMMPVFNGFETCQRMRGDPDIGPAVPIIFLTSTEIDPQKMQSVGATDYLSKHHMVADLKELLGKHLNK